MERGVKSFKVKRSKKGNCYTRKFCDDCLVDNKETKTIVCQVCNKPFTVGRKTGQYGFIQRKLCDNCFYTSITSIPEKKFENLLDKNDIKYTREYCINGLYYDFYLLDYHIIKFNSIQITILRLAHSTSLIPHIN